MQRYDRDTACPCLVCGQSPAIHVHTRRVYRQTWHDLGKQSCDASHIKWETGSCVGVLAIRNQLSYSSIRTSHPLTTEHDKSVVSQRCATTQGNLAEWHAVLTLAWTACSSNVRRGKSNTLDDIFKQLRYGGLGNPHTLFKSTHVYRHCPHWLTAVAS